MIFPNYNCRLILYQKPAKLNAGFIQNQNAIDRYFVNDLIRHHQFLLTHTMRGATTFILAENLDSKDFYSRTPCGVRLRKFRKIFTAHIISTHAHHAGCDWSFLKSAIQGAYFYSRTPCGVRHKKGWTTATKINFYSRTPCGVRHNFCLIITGILLFLLTHTMRGATTDLGRSAWESLISTHAHHAGCDRKMLFSLSKHPLHVVDY